MEMTTIINWNNKYKWHQQLTVTTIQFKTFTSNHHNEEKKYIYEKETSTHYLSNTWSGEWAQIPNQGCDELMNSKKDQKAVNFINVNVYVTKLNSLVSNPLFQTIYPFLYKNSSWDQGNCCLQFTWRL